MSRIKDITIIAILAAILFIQELALSGLPNIQLTILLIIVYTKTLGIKRTIFIVMIHTILDNLVWGFDLRYFIPMLIGWLLIPLSIGTLFRKVNKVIILALLGVAYAFIYSWLLSLPYLLISESAFIGYLAGDVLFEIILAASSFITILWLYEPLYKALFKLDNEYYQRTDV